MFYSSVRRRIIEQWKLFGDSPLRRGGGARADRHRDALLFIYKPASAPLSYLQFYFMQMRRRSRQKSAKKTSDRLLRFAIYLMRHVWRAKIHPLPEEILGPRPANTFSADRANSNSGTILTAARQAAGRHGNRSKAPVLWQKYTAKQGAIRA